MIIALALVLSASGESQSAPAASSTRWSLQVAPARCVLEGQDIKTGAALSIDTTPGSDNYRVAITTESIDGSAPPKPARLIFAPSQKVTKGFASVVTPSNNASIIAMDGVPGSVLDDLADTTTVTLEIDKGIKGLVSVTGTAKAVAALRKCNADQLMEWGADPDQFAPGGTEPTAFKSRDEWIPNSAFMKLAGESERLSINDDFRVLVATDGAITECHATADATEPGLEKRACAAVMGRRLFSPAKNARGDAVVGAAAFRVSLYRRPL